MVITASSFSSNSSSRDSHTPPPFRPPHHEHTFSSVLPFTIYSTWHTSIAFCHHVVPVASLKLQPRLQHLTNKFSKTIWCLTQSKRGSLASVSFRIQIQQQLFNSNLQVATALNADKPSSGHVCISNPSLATFKAFLVVFQSSKLPQGF